MASFLTCSRMVLPPPEVASLISFEQASWLYFRCGPLGDFPVEAGQAFNPSCIFCRTNALLYNGSAPLPKFRVFL